VETLGDGVTGFFVVVADGDKLGVRQFLEHARVILAKVANAYDSYPDTFRCRHTLSSEQALAFIQVPRVIQVTDRVWKNCLTQRRSGARVARTATAWGPKNPKPDEFWAWGFSGQGICGCHPCARGPFA
jgi:hypothetical protein